ncbi:malate dehydrogenase, NAD-dependent [Kwoniella mangroviensis CBS 10435]|uniref:malate dehydrogenase n=1 Tax=Kwoniella mangroviensis CBS 10435 TaxID=1331196 RepID=A0A1B9J332_9TREE|nr:malate dehydrogenase, NAD-dependent [Kwoniella mangroviensis CBS 8507]OCF62203.1 malate dehydrogenase, NAD-dependent [Kwoniella mangroviensis CBS 10435]OCF64414.1 malate dehydrogenase, NAD-dependent [Kwoniella mangroviensis CBS 8507]OCF73226.1 malate dehydrogenase, NAD-dependent [Kwoniella mangroviensis CBS 8886]
MVKAVVCGAAGGIGQPLSLLLKLNPIITELALYDVVNAVGVAADLSHIPTPAQVTGYLPPDNGAEKALKGADIVVIPAGVPRKPGMTRDDLFVNAGICATLAQAIANAAPKAFILVISNPVNSTVPVFAETLKKAGVFDPKRLLGVSHLDVIRASTFVASVLGKPTEAQKYSIPVVGGHSGATILPLLSQTKPAIPEILADKEKRDALVNRIQFGGDEVVKAKDGAGSATLSMAQAGAEFANYVIDAAFGGKKGKIVQSYINLAADAGGEAIKKEIGADLDYFSVNIELGPNGIEKILPIGQLDDVEKGLLEAAVKELGPSIEKGAAFQPAPPKL